MPKCEFIFDVGSPNSYLAWRILPEIEERTGVRFDYIPVLLGGIFKATGNSSPVVAYANVKGKLDYEMLELRRFIIKHGLTNFNMNPHFPVNTLGLMRGAVHAQNTGQLPQYMNAAMHHMWEEPKKMDDPHVVGAALHASGLDAAAIAEGSNTPEVKAKLIANTESATARGVFGAPSFFVGSQMFFGKDRLRDVEEEILNQQKHTG